MFRASRKYDVVYTGSDWVGLFFAIGQRLMRRKRVPHIFIDSLLTIEPSSDSIKRLLYRLAVQGSCRVMVQRSCEVESYAQALDVPREKFIFALYHSTIYDTPYTVRDDGYVFAGGDSDRDYPLLFEAVRGWGLKQRKRRRLLRQRNSLKWYSVFRRNARADIAATLFLWTAPIGTMQAQKLTEGGRKMPPKMRRS